ncbi:hypothetical protein D7X55_08455 [Corallococcus sp. AB049A]|uniref:hypothetical protein n=1 Tax=Corallococcus sp. AB049A TaxID=2316721 RepID=UPI000EBC01C4|nr:hypothetical protein [Corallococcus sp. AB049A]RKI71959.1 hypothetical protein D7X55_08455 [Corallococcus sp. AB049A]
MPGPGALGERVQRFHQRFVWFKGHATSVIQRNTDLPGFIWRAVLLAAREGYPSNHVSNSLLDRHLPPDVNLPGARPTAAPW